MSGLHLLDAVREVDFPERLARPESWPATVKVLCAGCLLLVSLSLEYWLCLHDVRARLGQAEAQELLLRQRFSSQAARASGLEPLRQQVIDLRSARDGVVQQWPVDGGVSGVLEAISRSGLESGVQIDGIRLPPGAASAFYIEQPIQLSLTGTYHALATFVSDLSRLPGMVAPHDFDIGPEKPPTGRLRMDIQARAYAYRDKDVSQ
ncbi:type 4a pilus biogenesis protein PilO [Pseudomonas sp. ABC1]|uniref:type 4a pilus biogenesis protein PilO n=1 Tax=Pseudomonas sp. ABC1 TaxID=2748080 RepID=UPI0015C3F8E3|nr:type 4a pilus biogenesis protein PilO [Pseudomonas sp. ABC1]QLF92896.1 type 4a pilus biogenesis protein PilO [Pseudomonas sp. ABC1]